MQCNGGGVYGKNVQTADIKTVVMLTYSSSEPQCRVKGCWHPVPSTKCPKRCPFLKRVLWMILGIIISTKMCSKPILQEWFPQLWSPPWLQEWVGQIGHHFNFDDKFWRKSLMTDTENNLVQWEAIVVFIPYNIWLNIFTASVQIYWVFIILFFGL